MPSRPNPPVPGAAAPARPAPLPAAETSRTTFPAPPPPLALTAGEQHQGHGDDRDNHGDPQDAQQPLQEGLQENPRQPPAARAVPALRPPPAPTDIAERRSAPGSARLPRALLAFPGSRAWAGAGGGCLGSGRRWGLCKIPALCWLCGLSPERGDTAVRRSGGTCDTRGVPVRNQITARSEMHSNADGKAPNVLITPAFLVKFLLFELFFS